MIRTKLRPGMELIVANCRLHNMESLRFQSEIPMVELSFWLNGSSEINMSGQQFHIENNQCQLAFMQHCDAEMQVPDGSAMLACKVRVEESVFFEMMGSWNGKPAMDLKHQLLASKPVRVFQQGMEPSEQLRARQFLHCPYVPALRNMYWEGIALELLATYTQRYLFDNSSARRNRKSLSRTELERIRAAAEMLVNRMDEPPTLPALSRLSGLSEFKLKAGFRDLYDTTVFGYLRDKRLAHALFLLESEQVSVYEVAIATGYSNPSHFAAVFREKFGINPGQWKKRVE